MTTKKTTTHLTGDNLQFMEQVYAQYLDDPDSVDASWKPLFEEYLGDTPREDLGVPNFEAQSIFSSVASIRPEAHDPSDMFVDRHDGTQIQAPGKTSGFAAKVEALVRAFRLHGHVAAKIDPLQIKGPDLIPALDPATYDLTAADMKTPVRYPELFNGSEVTLGQLIDRLHTIYCGTIGVEYQYISDPETRQWMRQQVERQEFAEIDGVDERLRIYKALVDADSFESFLAKKYQTAKRFSLSGGESLIPMLRALLEEGGKTGVQEVLVGMAHRGRLNVLHNIMNKPADAMFSEFEKTQDPKKYLGSSDVKYHMGYSSDYVTPAGHEIHLSMAFNPSHLEFVNPVVVGRARAKQARLGTEDAHLAIMPLVLHGDAAFAGQGVVAETLNLCDLDGYAVGGTVHVVINNQVGFTTNPEEARSTRYATDVAKMLEIPIFHVNGHDPEACVRVAKLALRYRQHFGRDVVIDFVCYRKYGHNEGDEPRFTQPQMYKVIDDMEPVHRVYAHKLSKNNIQTLAEADAQWDQSMLDYEPVFAKIKEKPRDKHVSTLSGLWKPFQSGPVASANNPDTTVSMETLARLGTVVSSLPEDLHEHRTVGNIFRGRKGKGGRVSMAAGTTLLDWGFAESLAFASLLDEGTPIRLSGQDCVRGTFSHRHAAVRNTETGEAYWPARHISETQGSFEVINSLLSETAVLGFEYGYSLDSPDALVMWEAQFGDFVNGAQVIIDQFINSGEDKWKRLSGVVMLLPHGYAGQGPEHSSARLERFLQLCAEDNMFVCNMTTPAQYFHALRRQMHINVRKPMIVMSPKSMLRHSEVKSTLDDLATGGFQTILPEVREDISADKVERVLLCSGKIYYDLVAYARANEIDTAAIVRVEQLYPLDTDALQRAVAPYNDAAMLWVQEEPKNMGAWSYIFPELLDTFGRRPTYVGRVASASPATGDPESHAYEQRQLVEQAFSI